MANLGFPFDPAAVARPCTYSDLPDIPAIQRLKSRRQWVCWRYVHRAGDQKPTKPLYQPANGLPASHSNPRHWGSYEEAVARAMRSRMDGVGYVLSDDDDLTGYDLDDCRNPETGEVEPWAQEIIDLAETYCEVSPSETGLRLIGEGKIEAAIKRDPASVEIYPKQRYLTITGWHVLGTPDEIRPSPQTLKALKERVAAFDAHVAAGRESQSSASLPVPGMQGAALPSPSPSASPFFREVNSAALSSLALWVPQIFGAAARFQPGTGAWRITSKALGRNLQEDLSIAPTGIRDWGVGDMGDARLGARTPVDLVIEFGFERTPKDAAFWLCHKLGRDPESFGWAEDDGTGAAIAASLLARQVVTVPSGEIVDAETGEFIVPARVEIDASSDYPDEALRVPGLIGDMADWIMSTAMFPCRLFATAAALAAVGTVIGRQVYTGVPRAGSSLYWLAIAPTAGGKDRPQEAIKQMFAAAGLSHLIKPSVSSSAKLGMALQEQPVQCQVIDEVGKVLRKFVARNASAQELALLDDYCSVWGKNLGSFEPEGVTTRSDTSIRQPCLTFFGATTPSNFYTQLRSAQVAGGFLNRFLVMQRHVRVPENTDIQPEDAVPPIFVEALQALRTWQDARLMPAPSHMADDAERPPAPFIIPASAEADALLADARARARAQILASDEDPVLEVYARSAEMVKRMALILACGRHWRDMASCRIEACDVTFAANLVDWSMASFVDGLRLHMAENEHQANAKMVLAIIRNAKGRKLTRSELYRKVDDRLQARELTGILANLCEAGKIEALEERPPEGAKGGRPKTTYILR